MWRASDDVVEGENERTYTILLKVADEHRRETFTGHVQVSYIFESLGSVTTCGGDETKLISQSDYQHTSLGEENFVTTRVLSCYR